MAITTVKIYPPIGVARLGNSPEFFVGPELPGDRTPPPGGYRDSHCRIKRQAARFRIFGYDVGGNLVQEVTQADATISWTAHIANTKASWRQFDGLNGSAPLRNKLVVADRTSLEIDPGPRTLTGPNQAAGFNTGRFLGSAIPLGEMRTDADGRLLLLGGFGSSGSVPAGIDITTYANNDGWYDDVSDGPVTATVTLNGTAAALTASPAWVLCTPPDFAPPIDSVTTLYDVLFQVAVSNGWLSVPANPSFTNDVYPILGRVLDIQRVNQLAASGHSSFPGAFPPAGSGVRQAVFNRVRDPSNPAAAGTATMPILWDDSNGNQQTITKAQYAILKAWKDGTVTNDWTGNPAPPATTISPQGLTRAALEACVGGAFFPGIEASWFLRDTYAYTEPFRLDHTGRKAGDVTKQMAVPWQADFFKCYAYGGYAWWPAQRPDEIFPEAGGGPLKWIRDIVFTHQDMVDQWHKLGFVVKKGGALVETQRVKVCTNIFLITDKSHFSEDEVAGLLTAGAPAKFESSLYVVAEGFLPSELGVTKANPTPAELAPIAPTVAIRRSDTTLVPGMTATPEKLLLEDASLPPAQRQRFTFVYSVAFANTDGFKVGGLPVETQTLTVTATKGPHSSSGALTLVHQPNPYMLDGAVSWLSTDVRVFQIAEGQARFGFTIGANATAALAYLSNVVGNFNTLGPVGHPYDTISTDQDASRLELSQEVAGKRVFNFALARVRYRGNVLDATDVRVFFRLFTTAATGLDYSPGSTYRRSLSGTAPISLLGLQGGEIVTIPCYGTARVDTSVAALDTQADPLNKRTLVHAGANESYGYFGCWLDLNQTTPQFPNHPIPQDGPWLSGRKSIQELIRGLHQCFVAEVFFSGDPIPAGASPASNDNLAQRNLAIVESENPGSPATHTVQHTFEVKATNPPPQLIFQDALEGEERERTFVPAGPDELMIDWGDLPRATAMTLYMPQVDAAEIMRLAGQNYEAMRLEPVDSHTIRCLPADVTYVPIPQGRTKNIPGLLTLEVPKDIKRRESFHVVVRQLSGRPRAVLGAFQLSIPVKAKADLLEPEVRALSVLRWIGDAIPLDDQWHPVFVRYLDQIAERVRGFGGDPARVAPSPAGTGKDEEEQRCARRGWLASGLLALLFVLAALNPLPGYAAEIVVGAAAAAAAALWHARCHPSSCRVITAAVVGLGVGAAVDAILWLAGAVGHRGAVVLSAAVLGLGIVVLLGVQLGCFRLTRR